MVASVATAQEPQMRWQNTLPREAVAILGYKDIATLVPLDLKRPTLAIDRPSFESWLGDWGGRVGESASWQGLPYAPTRPLANSPTEFLPPIPVKLTNASDDTTAGPDGILAQ